MGANTYIILSIKYYINLLPIKYEIIHRLARHLVTLNNIYEDEMYK